MRIHKQCYRGIWRIYGAGEVATPQEMYIRQGAGKHFARDAVAASPRR